MILYKSIVRLHLEQSLRLKKDISELEKMQQAIKKFRQLEQLSCEKRLQQ